eukprot:scaffold2188_cov388-Prasinococcus_capsulatus_cf.AAC.6
MAVAEAGGGGGVGDAAQRSHARSLAAHARPSAALQAGRSRRGSRSPSPIRGSCCCWCRWRRVKAAPGTLDVRRGVDALACRASVLKVVLRPATALADGSWKRMGAPVHLLAG